jgi:ribosomal RNA methyltransferase Nop2
MGASKPAGRSAAAAKPSGGRKLSASKFMASKPQRRAQAAAAESEEEEEEEGGSDGEAEAEEEEEEEGARVTAVERRAARLDRKKAALQADAQAEAQDAAVQEYEPFELPSADALDAEQSAPDLPSVRRRIQDVARVLANFKRLRQPGRTRAEYMERLMADLEHYYGCARGRGGARSRRPKTAR